jgi:mannose-6-phosphate isomerase-like protein (cupin superfamily)
MRHFVCDSAESYTVGPVHVSRWEQYSLDGLMPFKAMWYHMPPHSSAPRDCHPELELDVVISGTASVEIGSQITEVTQGSAFLMDGGEAHTIHNRTSEPLSVFATYWMPLERDTTVSEEQAS